MAFLSNSMACAINSTATAEVERSQKSRAEAEYDNDLVMRFNDGDEWAFTEIVGRHKMRLFSIAFSKVWNHGDAEEIVQDTFIRAHRGLATFRRECSLATWLHHVTLNLARNRYWYFHRRFRHATVSIDCSASEDDSSTILDSVACHSPCPLRETVTREFTDLIALCMQKLAEPQRTILAMTHTLGYGEIALQLGINVGTVKSRVARARDRLRDLLFKAYPEFVDGTQPAECLESTRVQGGFTKALNPR